MTYTSVIGSIALWLGALVGLLKFIDWFLSIRQKRKLTDWATTLWVWLDDQRLGEFISAVKSPRSQHLLSLSAHFIVILIVLSFLGRVFLDWSIPVEIYIGTPRIYLFQVWVDVAALLLSSVLLTYFLHPRLSSWISRPATVTRFFCRAGVAALSSYITLRLYIWGLLGAGLPLGQITWDGSKFLSPASFAPGTVETYGGKIAVLVVHTITALLGAPILIETFLLITILFCSVGWLLLIWNFITLHVLVKFIVLRIAEHKDGPVLGLSVMLVAIGALIKAFVW